MVFTIIVHLTAKSEHIEKVKAKLIEASRVYVNDKGTIDWFVSQGKKNSVLFCYLEMNTICSSIKQMCRIQPNSPSMNGMNSRVMCRLTSTTPIINCSVHTWNHFYRNPWYVIIWSNYYNSLFIVFDDTIGTPPRDRIGYVERSWGSSANMVRWNRQLTIYFKLFVFYKLLQSTIRSITFINFIYTIQHV